MRKRPKAERDAASHVGRFSARAVVTSLAEVATPGPPHPNFDRLFQIAGPKNTIFIKKKKKEIRL